MASVGRERRDFGKKTLDELVLCWEASKNKTKQITDQNLSFKKGKNKFRTYKDVRQGNKILLI